MIPRASRWAFMNCTAATVFYEVPLGAVALNGTFVFTDDEGNELTNSIAATPFSWTPPTEFDTCGMTAAYSPALADNETVQIRGRGVDSAPGALNYVDTSDPLEVPADQLASLVVDPTLRANVWMVRKTEGTLAQPTANERGEIDYVWSTPVERGLEIVCR